VRAVPRSDPSCGWETGAVLQANPQGVRSLPWAGRQAEELKSATVKELCRVQNLHDTKVQCTPSQGRSFHAICCLPIPYFRNFPRLAQIATLFGLRIAQVVAISSFARKLSESRKPLEAKKLWGLIRAGSDRAFEAAISTGFRVPIRVGRGGRGPGADGHQPKSARTTRYRLPELPHLVRLETDPLQTGVRPQSNEISAARDARIGDL